MKRILMTSAVFCAFGANMGVAQDLIFSPGEGNFTWASFEALKDADLSGEVITVAGPWLAEERDMVESVFAYFEAATGADVQYSGSDSFEQQIVIDSAAGSAPNIAIFPQPGPCR